jgi:S-adenosylmethionine decarboxylase proenzyme
MMFLPETRWSHEIRFINPLHSPLSLSQHLLVDIKGIEADFLDSEERLSKAMVDTVDSAGLTMLSYHCHSLVPGISCVGVLLESHISFHTWPKEGVITLDLFTCGSNPLLPVIATIKELFGIGENIEIQWSHELRGFRRGAKGKEEGDAGNFALLNHHSDISQMVWSPFGCTVKEQVFSSVTKFQRVDIWDLVGVGDVPTQEDAKRHNLQPGDPRWITSELVSPERTLFLDGVMQSDSGSYHEFHEALVHPAMFAHPNPRHVAIIGGGEGATLREVLKHKTVKSATMIEIDGELVDVLKEFYPEYSNCSDFVGRAENCFDDEVATLVLEDGTTDLV